MRKYVALLTMTVAVVTAYWLFPLTSSTAIAEEVELYKNPQCGCCENYAGYLRENGYTVTVNPTHELVAMSRAAGIPEGFEGCHLAFVDGYVVSGHVPISTVNRVLTERSDIKGITLPGMPTGSPGMGGAKSEPFMIYEVGPDSPKVYAVE